MTGQPAEVRSAIAAMGRVLGPRVLSAVQDLFATEQACFAQAPDVADCTYGGDARQRLDLYLPRDKASAPVLLWVHGGGFVRGEKRSEAHPFNAHIGRWAARNNMVGAVMNYRLAPDHGWPAGGEDVGAAIDWIGENVAPHGGDPARIVLMGTSAGAVHAATHLQLRGDAPGIAAAVLLSGLYGFTELEERDTVYYGASADYFARAPRAALIATRVPLLVACAELDPPRFQSETAGLLAARLAGHGSMPRAIVVGGHNHFSLASHIGGADTRLADQILDFIGALP